MIVIASLVSTLTLLFLVIQIVLSNESHISDPQLTSLESGFEALNSNLILGSSFFIIAVLYVLFDIELVLLLPLIVICLTPCLGFIISVLGLISLTLFLEWFWCGFNWQT